MGERADVRVLSARCQDSLQCGEILSEAPGHYSLETEDIASLLRDPLAPGAPTSYRFSFAWSVVRVIPSKAAARVRCQPVSFRARSMSSRSAVAREKSPEWSELPPSAPHGS
ncbi:hypothetical protein LCGC14_2334690 [marine sediment metagenome]|uniref:Uncharacterized protein n=1 Tax=marine sediment metagenome TaxID=412755 RepID=A0A0F9CDR7_9ZZZZ